MKIRKLSIRILLVLLGLVAAVLVVRAVLNFTEGRRLARTLADLKAQGVPLTVKELITPCSEGENGATLWKAAEELYAFDGGDVKLLNEAYRKLYLGQPITADVWASISQLVEKNRRVLDFIPEVAGKPCFQYGATDVRFWERRIPDAIKMIRAVRLWGFESLQIAERGDVRGALDRLRIGFRFAPKNAEESSLMTYLIALANAKTCLLFLNKSLEGREAGEGILLPVLADLDERQIEHWKTLLRTGMRGERVMFIDLGLVTDIKTWARELGAGGWWERLYYWLIKPLIKRDVSQSLPVYADLETKAALPYYQTRDFWRPYKDHLEGLPWYAVVSKLAIPEMEATFLKAATFDALILTARVGLACRIFKSRTGAYPDSLEALVPELLKGVPVDPFTGKPLVYRREGEGFIVYSLGSNQKDDGGRSTWEIKQLVTEKDDDWTWKEDK
jgi:hypothetical protein